ncbi:MAG: transcriptional regulator [Firmicutes bacterium]|nr:transcriptional regulator [Bacillota bacterium]
MNVYESITKGLQEAIEYTEGKPTGRTVVLTNAELPTFSAEEIKEIRHSTHLTQSNFAFVLGVSPRTVEAWEIGVNSPAGSARRILSFIKQDPDFLEKYNLVST